MTVCDESKNYYYVGEDNVQRGPLPGKLLVQLVRDGTITSKLYVWTDGFTEWTSFSEVFSPEIGNQPPPFVRPITTDSSSQGCAKVLKRFFLHIKSSIYSSIKSKEFSVYWMLYAGWLLFWGIAIILTATLDCFSFTGIDRHTRGISIVTSILFFLVLIIQLFINNVRIRHIVLQCSIYTLLVICCIWGIQQYFALHPIVTEPIFDQYVSDPGDNHDSVSHKYSDSPTTIKKDSSGNLQEPISRQIEKLLNSGRYPYWFVKLIGKDEMKIIHMAVTYEEQNKKYPDSFTVVAWVDDYLRIATELKKSKGGYTPSWTEINIIRNEAKWRGDYDYGPGTRGSR